MKLRIDSNKWSSILNHVGVGSKTNLKISCVGPLPTTNAAHDDYEKVYQDYWKDIIEPNGKVDLDQVKKELADFYLLIREVPKVYTEITGGKLSYPNYDSNTVIQQYEIHMEYMFEQYYADDYKDEIKSLTEYVEELEETIERLEDGN